MPFGKMDKKYPFLLNHTHEIDRTQRRLGDIIKKVWRTAADSALPRLKEHLGSDEEAIRICEQTKREQAQGNIHAYFNMYFEILVYR